MYTDNATLRTPGRSCFRVWVLWNYVGSEDQGFSYPLIAGYQLRSICTEAKARALPIAGATPGTSYRSRDGLLRALAMAISLNRIIRVL